MCQSCAGLSCTALTQEPVSRVLTYIIDRLLIGPATQVSSGHSSCRPDSLSQVAPISSGQACLHLPNGQAVAQAEDGVPAHTLRML